MTNPNPLKFEVMLSESDELHVGMVRGDPVSYDPNPDENRAESARLRGRIETEIPKTDVEVERREYRRSADDRQNRNRHYSDGGYDSVTLFTETIKWASGAGLGAFLLRAGKDLIAWRKLRPSRTVTIDLGDHKFHVADAADLEKATEALKQMASGVGALAAQGALEKQKKKKHSGEKKRKSADKKAAKKG